MYHSGTTRKFPLTFFQKLREAFSVHIQIARDTITESPENAMRPISISVCTISLRLTSGTVEIALVYYETQAPILFFGNIVWISWIGQIWIRHLGG